MQSKNVRSLFLMLILLNTISFIATNIYVPAMPAMGEYFNTDKALIQLSMPTFMLPFCVVPLILAPLSDKYGRRNFVILGLIIALLANISIVSFQHVYVFLVARFVQGGAFGMITICARALIADNYSGQAMAKFQTHIQTLTPFISLSCPVVGGCINDAFSWQMIFVFLIVYVAFALIMTLVYMPNRQKSVITKSCKSSISYYSLIKNRAFMSFAFIPALLMLGQCGYTVLGTYLFQEQLGLSATHFALVNIPVYAAISMGGCLNIVLIRKMDPKQIIKLGGSLMIIASGIMLAGAYTQNFQGAYIVLASAIYFLSTIIINTNACAQACDLVQGQNGRAFALMSSLKMASGIVVGTLVSVLPISINTLVILFLIAGTVIFSLMLAMGTSQSPVDEIIPEACPA